MKFTTLALCLLSGGALAQTTVHVVSVSSSNGSLTYTPNNLAAAVGDMIQFQFYPANHTVTQSTFDQPCTPINNIMSNVTGLFSGFMPVEATATTAPLYTVMVKSTTPMWLYCSQAKHCQSGMVMVVNENTAANSTRSLANFKSLAAKATSNTAPTSISGGTAGSTSTSTNGAASTTTSSGSGTKASSGASGAFGQSGELTFGAAVAVGMWVLL